MTKKQRDLKKLKAYSRALGLKTVFKKGKRENPGASWSTDLVLTFYIRSYTTAKQTILNFLHELGHHRSYIAHNKIHNDMLLDALNTEDTRQGPYDHKVDKSMRELILKDEIHASTFRQDIRKQLDLESVTELDLDVDIKLDIWIYTFYYKKGEFPTLKQVSNARKNIISNVTTRRKNDKRNGLIR
jgi:hypothetical protein